MKRVYFVTEGPTDQIVLEALVREWLGSEDFIPNRIQPPAPAFAVDLDENLSTGWKGVLAWCSGKRPVGPAGRDEALDLANCLIIHTDADVARDSDFADPAYAGTCPPAGAACDWVRAGLTASLGGTQPDNVVFCVPAQDLEAWVVSALHPDVADANAPIECRAEPGALLVQRPPYKLVRRKDGSLKKERSRYEKHADDILAGWPNCAGGDTPRCPEAARFEAEARAVLTR